MRLYLLPITTRRTLLYAQRLGVTTVDSERGLLNKAVASAARLWTRWEAKEKGWQRKVVDYGNKAMRRIDYEEWGLKSVPPLSARRKAEELQGMEKVELVFPGRIIPLAKAEGIAREFATKWEGGHRKSMIRCLVGMPFTIPFALVPIIPNLPFFYLAWRAWSHWRTIAGGRHIQWLAEKKLLQLSPSTVLDRLYSNGGKIPPQFSPGRGSSGFTEEDVVDAINEEFLITEEQARSLSVKLGMPALALELERAIWQIEERMKEDKNLSLKLMQEWRSNEDISLEYRRTLERQTRVLEESVRKDKSNAEAKAKAREANAASKQKESTEEKEP